MDDMYLYFSFSCITRQTVDIVNQCLRAVIVRLTANKAEVFLISKQIDSEIEFQPRRDGINLT